MWPDTVYPDEVENECPEAKPEIAALFLQMATQGPSPLGYVVKNLGKKKNGLWQINLKVEKRQIRILYAPYGKSLVLFRIHKKSSPHEQTRAYELAGKRKRNYEATQRDSNEKRSTRH